MPRRLFILVLGLVAAMSAPAADEVSARLRAAQDKLVAGATLRLAVEITIAGGWHINANPASEDLIPTELTMDLPPGVMLAAVEYPAGHPTRVGWSDDTIRLYSGSVVVFARIHVAPEIAPGPVTVRAALRYQACDDDVCLAPQTIPLTWETVIVADPQLAQPMHGELFASQTAAVARPAAGENRLATLLRQGRWGWALVLIFLGGLALNLTPCVYPMIAITVSYFGAQGEKRVGVALARAATYCLGIVLTYSTLGLIAALTGGLFGALLQSPIVLIGVAVLLVALALSMFGVYELQPPAFLMQRAVGLSARAGWLGVFLLGAAVGVIAAPCLGPIILSVFVIVAQRGDPWLGWWLFFTLACGLGLPYVVLGTFSGLLAKLPKSGFWLVWIKRALGVALLAVAVWFVKPLWATRAAPDSPIAWQRYTPELVATATRPVLIDFYADWCIPCHEMDKRTFTDERVIAASKDFLMVKADLTRTGDLDVQRLTEQFQIVGVPTFVFLGADGSERAQLRQVGFVAADDFLAVMTRALTAPATTNVPPADPAWETPPALLHSF